MPGKYDNDRLTFRAVMDYQLTDDATIFGSFNCGYKSGEFNLLGFDPNVTKAEVVDAYEIGIRSELFDRRVRFDISAFWYDITNPQVQLLIVTVSVLANAQNARTRGAKFTGHVGMQYSASTSVGEVTASADYNYSSGIYCDPYNFLCQAAYHMGNAQLTLKPYDTSSVSDWSRNIANEKILSYVGTQVGATGYPYLPAAPRTWGFTAEINS